MKTIRQILDALIDIRDEMGYVTKEGKTLSGFYDIPLMEYGNIYYSDIKSVYYDPTAKGTNEGAIIISHKGVPETFEHSPKIGEDVETKIAEEIKAKETPTPIKDGT